MLKKPDCTLRMVADEEPRLVQDGRETPLTRNRPTASQVRSIVKEVASKEALASLASSGSARFEHRLAPNLAVVVTASGWAGRPELHLSLPDAAGSATPIGGAQRPPRAALDTAAKPPREQKPMAAVPAHAGSADLVPIPQAGDNHPMDGFFRLLASSGSSDLHMSSKEVPMIRKDGEMQRITHAALSSEELFELLEPIMPEPNRAEFEADGDTDFAYSLEGVARFRANMFRDRHGVGAVFRTIPSKILTAEALGLSDHIKNLSKLSKGLVLVTGPTGSGKSTTLCALVDLINRTRADHIITIEDPIEFVHDNKMCLVNQREVGVHTKGFKRALRAALREDPDIVLVGEMRDLETIAIAIETAETGHLVFGTLHTSTAYSTIDRIIDQFPPDQQEQIRVMLSESLRGVISQTLCKKIGGGRVAALEVLLSTPAVANLIREGKTFQIPSIMQTSKNIGMVLLNESLVDLVLKKTITVEEAIIKAVDKRTLASMLKQAGINVAA